MVMAFVVRRVVGENVCKSALWFKQEENGPFEMRVVP